MDDWTFAIAMMGLCGLLIPIPLLLAVRWIEVQFERRRKPHETAAE